VNEYAKIHVRRLQQQGNQHVINIPRTVCTQLKIGKGDYVWFWISPNGTVEIGKYDPNSLRATNGSETGG